MISHSRGTYIFIRIFVFWFRSIAPLSLLYSCLLASKSFAAYRLPVPFEIYLVAETAFWLFIFGPRRHFLQRPSLQPPPAPTRAKRRDLFEKCQSTVSDPQQYWSLWFKGVPLEKIGRDNVKDWISWGFLNKEFWDVDDDEELEEYVSESERLLGKKFEPGRREATPMRPTLDRVKILHRPLLYYLFGVVGDDAIAYLHLVFHSFQFYSMSRFFASFPPRPLTLLGNKRSPAPHISYYYRPHTSKSYLPVLYIHGVGILNIYLKFLAEFSRASGDGPGDIGFIFLEIKPISFYMTHAALSKDEMCAEILSILQKHKWDKFVLMANSYGTAISTQMLKNVEIAPRIGPVLFVDPIPFLINRPELVYNFLYRVPQSPSEHQLYYFACTDMGAAHTLTRRMFWSDNVLWKEDVEGRRMTVVLSQRDIIVDAEAVGRYLTREKGVRAADDHRGNAWKKWAWKGESLDVLWLDGLNHAEVFNTKADREILLKVLLNYCKDEHKEIPKRGPHL